MAHRSTLATLGAVRRVGVYLRGRRRCAWCARPVAFADLQLDHVHPRHAGGRDRVDNLVPVDALCNATREDGEGAMRAHLAALGVRLRDAWRRVRRQLARPVDRHRALPVALRCYAWLAARIERDRADARARMAKRAKRQREAREEGLGGAAFPFGGSAP